MNGAALPQGRLARVMLTLSRDKSDTLLLLGATMLVLAPHTIHLPPWVSALCAITLAWRALITFRGTRMPPALLLLPLAAAAMVGVYLTYKTLFGREAGVAMAVLLVTFKLLEMHARRDLFVVIYLCFFLLLTNFFYSQSIAMGAMMLAAVIALLTAQLSFQFTGAVPPLLKRVGVAVRTIGLAAPLAVALFVLFPRVQGPLWGLPGDAGSGRTGLSNSMAPGNIANLAESSEIAFRVKFSGEPPPQSQLYWRGVVFSDFDGRTWTQPPRRDWRAASRIKRELRGEPIDYQVTLEPHQQQWLFVLDMPGTLPQVPNMGVWHTGSMEVRSGIAIERRIRYDARSYTSYTLDGGDELYERERWLALPEGFNPVARHTGMELRREPDPLKRVRAVLNTFRRDGYSYTLQPPLLASNTVDDFLYRTKAGFCEHYASSFVYLMRAADVPARVVTGYQGGELNPVDGYVTVRQSEAHAWAEVWLGERGWVRIDPTAAVSPDRIERNLARALPADEGLVGGIINLRMDKNSWLNKVRFQFSAFSNGWDQWVLSYDQQRRRSVLEAVTEAFGNWRTLASIGALLLLFLLGRALRRRQRRDPVETLYAALGTQLGRAGLARAPAEGPNAWSARIGEAAIDPARKQAIQRFLQLYSAHKYGPGGAPAAGVIPAMKKLLQSAR